MPISPFANQQDPLNNQQTLNFWYSQVFKGNFAGVKMESLMKTFSQIPIRPGPGLFLGSVNDQVATPTYQYTQAGPMGPAGLIGPGGPGGGEGLPGAQGPAGPAGPAGSEGTQGPAGPQGDPGPGCTDMCQGLTSYLSELSLTGEPGSPGEPGAPGTCECSSLMSGFICHIHGYSTSAGEVGPFLTAIKVSGGNIRAERRWIQPALSWRTGDSCSWEPIPKIRLASSDNTLVYSVSSCS